MDARGARVAGRGDRRGRRQWRIRHGDPVGGGARASQGVGCDRGDLLANEPHHTLGEDAPVGHRAAVVDVTPVGQVGAGQRGEHPGARSGGGHVDAIDPGVCVRAAADRGMQHARQMQVSGVTGSTGGLLHPLDVLDGRTDEGGHAVVDDGHRVTPARAAAVRRSAVDDALVASAAADVAGDLPAQRGVVRRQPGAQQRHRTDQLPGVQKPHWKADAAANSARRSAQSSANPSIVCTCPVTRTARVIQASTGRPSISTVQAPHSPRPHASLVPVSPSWSRSRSSSRVSGASASVEYATSLICMLFS